MGRKQEDRLCCGMKMLALIPVLIVLTPSWFFTPDTYAALIGALRKGWSTGGAKSADTLFLNATIWTGDSQQPWAQSLAVANGRILSIGHPTQLMEIGPDTKVVNLEGKFVTPGFIDSHVHFISGGLQMTYVQLGSVRSRAEFASKLEQTAQEVKKGQWIVGVNWNNENWGGKMPQASWIDTPDHPTFVCRLDGHTCLANSVALAIADIHRDTPEPQGGTIVRNNEGDPTGLLLDTAMSLITRCIPQPSIKERRAALARASKLALSNGVTSVIDFGRITPGAPPEQPWMDFNDVYLWADAAGTMRVRVSTFFPLTIWPTIADFVMQRGHDVSQWLRVNGVKEYADGSLGSGTALFHQAYADNISNYGLQVADTEWLLKAISGADNAGLQVAVHAIGDAANDNVLSVFEAVKSKNGPRDRRFRIEHAQHLSAGAPQRFGASGVIASMQPDHMRDDAHYAARRLGEERTQQGSFLLKSLLDNGTQLALGSDWTVAPIEPLIGMQAAATRIPLGWKSTWIPSEIISCEAALTGYTTGAAYASFRDSHVGSLSPGKYADFVLLSHSPLDDCGEKNVPTVLSTYVGGSIAYQRFGDGAWMGNRCTPQLLV